MAARVAQPGDIDQVTTIISAAFTDDPLWSWAIPQPGQRATLWRFMLASTLRHGCTWIADRGAAAATWIPPGADELTPEAEQRLPALLGELCGPRAGDVTELMERFAANHPTGEPHYYLSLLGTHPDHRGRGIGMALLAENLAAFDAAGIPTYLESSNPANVGRYEAIGYRRVGSFTTPDDRRTVVTLWRDAG
jgi:GNAT superfamily N-acetyltransferase